MKVYQCINAVQQQLSATGISKGHRNQQQGYNFRGIDDFPGYSVTECGRVFSDAAGRFLSPRMVNGYHHVTLGGRAGRQVAVHVLVASAFIGPRQDGQVVNHKNGARTDNSASNLEWVTQSENVAHAYRTGLRVINQAHRDRAAKMGRAKRSFSDDQAACIRSAYSGQRGQITALAAQHGLSRHAISTILGGMK